MARFPSHLIDLGSLLVLVDRPAMLSILSDLNNCFVDLRLGIESDLTMLVVGDIVFWLPNQAALRVPPKSHSGAW